MSKEFFQDNQSLDAAYNKNSLNIIGSSLSNLSSNNNTNNGDNDSNNYHDHIDLQDSKMNFNIWDIMGVTNLDRPRQNCLLDCAISTAENLDKCNRYPKNFDDFIYSFNKKSCNYRSYKSALECSKKCYNKDNPHYVNTNEENITTENTNNSITEAVIPTINVPTTQLTTTQISNEIDKLKFPGVVVPGYYADIDEYSPHESKYWPSDKQYGWEIDKIVEYNKNLGDNIIEVQTRKFFPSDTESPYLEFKS